MQLLFADQLGQHFDLGGEILLPEVLSQFRKRRYHRQKAHLTLYAIRARARDERVNLIQLDNYRDLAERTDLEVAVSPTSRPMLAMAESLNIEIKAARGFCSSKSQFQDFAGDKKRLRLEDFYRQQRSRLGVLMEGSDPIGGQWNFDESNRLPPPKSGLGLTDPWAPLEDELDAEVRSTLDELEASGVEFTGSDGYPLPL